MAEADTWRIEETSDYICSRGFTIVTAQFPDELLPDAPSVAFRLKRACSDRGHQCQIYVLADTTYNSLSVDEVAAAHVDAQCVIHYGRASLTKLSRVPAFYVFPSQPLDVVAVADALASSGFFNPASGGGGCAGPAVIFLDQVHLDSRAALEAVLRERLRDQGAERLAFADVPSRSAEPQQRQRKSSGGGCGAAACCSAPPTADEEHAELHPNSQELGASICSAAGYTWSIEYSNGGGGQERISEDSSGQQPAFVWVGSSQAPALTQLQLTHSTAPWLTYDPCSALGAAPSEGLPPELMRTLRRRYYLVEKAREAAIVGLVVGTLGAAGYGDALRTLRRAAQDAGKKTYTVLMGKPSPAKLANFPEIEVFVLVADPQGQILECKEYLAPIITPHEAMLAFAPESEWVQAEYRLDFDHVLASQHQGSSRGEEGGADSRTAVALVQQSLIVTPAAAGGSHLVQARSAADYLVHKRSWKGVEAPLVGAERKEAHAAVPGQSGRAAGYAGK